MQVSRVIATIPVATGSGTQNINVLLDPLDLSHAKALEMVLRLTTAATVHATTFQAFLQSTNDDSTLSTSVWNDRIATPAVAGDQSVSPAYVYHLNVQQDVDLQSPERGYVDSGTTGTHIPGGTVVDGLFPPRFRNAQGVQSNWRVREEITDAAASGNFVGVIQIIAHEWDLT